MNRRNFFKSLGVAAAGLMATPLLGKAPTDYGWKWYGGYGIANIANNKTTILVNDAGLELLDTIRIDQEYLRVVKIDGSRITVARTG